MRSTGPDVLSKNIRQEIKQGLKSGNSKQDLLIRFRTDENENQLRRFLAKFPDKRPGTVFKILNIIAYVIWIVLVLGSFLALFETLNLASILTFIVLLLIAIEIIKFNGYIYLPGIICLILILIQWCFEVVHMTNTGEFNEDGIVEITYFIFIILPIAIIIMTIVRKKIFGHFNWFLPSKDKNGYYIFESDHKN
jgi:hypothetical protein